MIYPATYNITVLQNSTWSAAIRATGVRQQLDGVTVAGGAGTFTGECHGFVEGDKVVFTADPLTGQELQIPCGLELNAVYYVIAAGLTADTFKVSATLGGSEIALTSDLVGTLYVAQPMNLTGYVVDADIYNATTNTQLATMTCALTDSPNGVVTLTIPPATSAALSPGSYPYDVSFTSSVGTRYYFLKGVATVERTYSRN